MSARRCWILVVCPLLALALGACGHKLQHPHVADANNNGFYIDAGPVSYQLQVSRELNQYNVEDMQYLAGLPTGTPSPSPDQLWYGVFLLALNQTGRPQVTTDKFDIVDTQGNRYYPYPLDANTNPLAWSSQAIPPGGTQPGPNTIASEGPTQGGELLFKLNTSVYANRPLTLEVRGPANQLWGAISLDL